MPASNGASGMSDANKKLLWGVVIFLVASIVLFVLGSNSGPAIPRKKPEKRQLSQTMTDNRNRSPRQSQSSESKQEDKKSNNAASSNSPGQSSGGNSGQGGSSQSQGGGVAQGGGGPGGKADGQNAGDVPGAQPVPAKQWREKGLPKVKSAQLAVQLAPDEEPIMMDISASQITPIPGTDYSIKMTGFYTHHAWGLDGRARNLSNNEANPAAHVEIYQDGKMIYDSWGFQDQQYYREEAKGPDGKPRVACSLMGYEGLTLPE